MTETNENIVPAAKDAFLAGATLAEAVGAIRLGYGYSFDPVKLASSPLYKV